MNDCSLATVSANHHRIDAKRSVSKRFWINQAKRCAIHVSQTTAFDRLIHLVERWRRADHDAYRLPVLTYHRVDTYDRRPDLQPGLISATPDQFEAQMRYLHEQRDPVTLNEVIAAVMERRPLSTRSVLVTFDDAYEDFAIHAWPVLKRFGIPCVMFVATDFPDSPQNRFWWDRLHASLECPATDGSEFRSSSPGRAPEAHSIDTPCGRLMLRTAAERQDAYRRLRSYIKSIPHEAIAPVLESIWHQRPGIESSNGVMGWEMLRRLKHEGLTLAPHTQSHPLMTRLTDPQMVRSEIEQSWNELNRQVGTVPQVLAYPSGAVNDSVVKAVRDLRFPLAFTTQRGVNDLRRSSPWLLKRINVGRLTNVPLLRTQLAVMK